MTIIKFNFHYISKKYIFVLVLLSTVISCQQEEQLPEGLLNHKQMVGLMVDVELMQAELKYDFTKANQKIDPEPRFEEVFKQHGLTRESFNSNLEYYGARPLQMKDIYVDVIEELSRAQAEIQ